MRREETRLEPALAVVQKRERGSEANCSKWASCRRLAGKILVTATTTTTSTRQPQIRDCHFTLRAEVYATMLLNISFERFT